MYEAEQDTPRGPWLGIIPRSAGLMLAAFYMGLFIIRPWEVLFPSLAPFHFERLCGIVVTLGVAVTSGFRFRFNLQNLAVVVFLGTTSIAAAYAYAPSTAWDKLYVVLTLVVCYFVLVSVIRTPYELLFLIAVYIGFMEMYLTKALWEFYIHGRHSYTMSVTRLIGIETSFGGPNALAGSIVLSMPFWWLLWRQRSRFTAGWEDRWRRRLDIALRSYAVLAVWSILLTNSRTGMINLCVFVFLAGLRQGAFMRNVRNLMLAALMVCVGWLVLPEEQRERARTIWNSDLNAGATASAQGRIDGLKAGLEMFRRFPALGVGPGCFASYRVLNLDGVNLVAHNMPGQILGETGTVGLIGFLFLLTAPLVNQRRLRKIAQNHDQSDLTLLSDVGFACRNVVFLILVDGMSGDSLYRYNWLWLGAFCSLALQFAVSIRDETVSASEKDEQSAPFGSVLESESHTL